MLLWLDMQVHVHTLSQMIMPCDLMNNFFNLMKHCNYFQCGCILYCYKSKNITPVGQDLSNFLYPVLPAVVADLSSMCV